MTVLQEFAVKWGVKQEGGVIPGKHGHFLECNGQVCMKTPTKLRQITTDEEARAAVKEIDPDSDWELSE